MKNYFNYKTYDLSDMPFNMFHSDVLKPSTA